MRDFVDVRAFSLMRDFVDVRAFFPGFFWFGVPGSGIMSCGSNPVDPVSYATCYYTDSSNFSDCVASEYILVQTTQSDHHWALKADANCSEIARPDWKGLVPCLLNDSFDSVNGCTPFDNQSGLNVEGGYIQLETNDGRLPPASHCADSTHYGRMVVDSVNSVLYICMAVGWAPFN